MDGLLVVDKPSGPTSHDVVAIVRRLLDTRAGHIGTLDPLASGVLPVLVGRATRLARFMSGADKSYEATVRLGSATDTYDAAGEPTGPAFAGPLPTREEIEAALDHFRGAFEQQPPVYSAKKIGGRPSYALARRARHRKMATSGAADPPAPAVPTPTRVTVHDLALVDVSDADVRLRLRCSAGFYVRALAHDLGTALGTGAHLTALRRTAVAGVDAEPVPLATLLGEQGRAAAVASLIPPGRLLPGLPAVMLRAEAVPLAQAGRELSEHDATSGFAEALGALAGGATHQVRLLDPAGQLVAMAEAAATAGALHPFVVLI